MIDNYHGIPSMMHLEEREWFLRCCGLAPLGAAVDLGAYRGATAAMMCDVRGSDNVWVIDNWKMNQDGGSSAEIVAKNLEALSHFPTILTQRSDATPPKGIRVGFLSIDSQHVGHVVVREMETWRPTLVPGAMVLLHDCDPHKYASLTRMVDQIFGKPEWTLTGQVLSLRAYRLKGDA